MKRYSVRKLTDKDAPRADAFVLNFPSPAIEQTYPWAAFQNDVPGRKHIGAWAAFDENGEIAALVHVVSMYTGMHNWRWAYSNRGPIGTNNMAIKVLLKHVGAILKRNTTCLFWRADPAWDYPMQKQIGLNTWRKEATSFHPTNALVIDLTPSEKEILAQMKRKGRYNITIAKKKGVQIQSWSGDKAPKKELQTFAKMMQETAQRDGFSGHDAEYYSAMLRHLAEHARLYMAYTESKKPIAGAILTLFGPKATYYFGASSGDPRVRPLMAPYALQWAMMCDAKAAGATAYDMTGISPESAKNHPFDGITQFKTRFGGARCITASGREKALRPALYILYRLAKSFRKALRSVM